MRVRSKSWTSRSVQGSAQGARATAASAEPRDATDAARHCVRTLLHLADRGFRFSDLARQPLPGGADRGPRVISRTGEMMPRRSQLALGATVFAAMILF